MVTTTNSQPTTARRAFLLSELWAALRPYFISLLEDWLIAVALWALLWLFKKITGLAPIEGWAGEFIVNIHAAGTVMAYGIFVGMFIWDIIDIRRKRS